jgi:hypothetical protein
MVDFYHAKEPIRGGFSGATRLKSSFPPLGDARERTKHAPTVVSSLTSCFRVLFGLALWKKC